jgi:hypothetical protein
VVASATPLRRRASRSVRTFVSRGGSSIAVAVVASIVAAGASRQPTHVGFVRPSP